MIDTCRSALSLCFSAALTLFAASCASDGGGDGPACTGDKCDDPGSSAQRECELACNTSQESDCVTKCREGKAMEHCEARRSDAVDFWTKCDVGDRALTRLIAADDDAHRERATSDLVAAYQRAFASRSTWGERQSPLDHLRDLASLLEAADPRLAFLERACAQLVQWEDVHVEETVDEADASA